ncbi:MAG TPA: sulfatase-like hydrolase/transferase [Thermoclostridium sp.]
MSNKTNILIITTDQQRWDTMKAYGNNIIKTPNLDRLAEGGAVFENAITPCPMCMPARTCLMTGFSASKLGVLDNYYPENIDNRDTLAVKLSNIGYRTQAIGKMHFSNKPYTESYGMDNMILSEEMRGVRFAQKLSDIVYDDYDKFLIERGMWGWEKPTEIGYNEIKPLINYLPREYHITQWCGDETVEWLKNKRPKDRPFFLWSSFVKPHVPYDCPEHLTDLYKEEDMPEPWVSDKDGTHKNPYFAQYRKVKEFDLYSDTAARRARAYYYSNITFIDEQIGRIIDTLKEEGIYENTLIVFTSDHGDLMGDHRLWYKSFGYEGSIHIPLVLHHPKRIKPGTRCSEIASLIDILPTVSSAVGINIDNGRPGNNLFDLISGDKSCDFGVSEIFTAPDYMIHVRTKEWKYLFYQNGGFEELYNLKEDPHEMVDLADDKAYACIKKELHDAAVEWILKYGNPEYSLDKNRKLRAVPFHNYTEQQYKPFSRMPWDYRIPPLKLSSDKRGWFWNQERKDWSYMVELARCNKT